MSMQTYSIAVLLFMVVSVGGVLYAAHKLGEQKFKTE